MSPEIACFVTCLSIKLESSFKRIVEKYSKSIELISEPTQEVSKWPTPIYRKAGIQELICPFIQLTLPTLTQKNPPALWKSPPYRNQQLIHTNLYKPTHQSTHPPTHLNPTQTHQHSRFATQTLSPRFQKTQTPETNPLTHPSILLPIYPFISSQAAIKSVTPSTVMR